MKQAAIDFLFVLNAAITNIRLYPPASDIIQRSLDRMHSALDEALAEGASLDFAESEKNLLVCGEPLPEKQQQRPQVRSFLTLMLDLDIRSITFSPGIQRPEISAFLQIIGKTPDEIAAGGGLHQMMADQEITNISIDEKVYVQRDSEHQILSGVNLSDEALARHLLGEAAADPEAFDQVKKMAADPDWLGRVLETGARHILDRSRQGEEKEALAGKLSAMMDAISDLFDMDRQQAGRSVTAALSEKAPPEDLKEILARLQEKSAGPDAAKSGESGAGQEGEGKGETAEKPKRQTSGPERAEMLKQAFARIMKGETAPFSDPEVAGAIPEAVSQWLDKGKENNVDALTDRMEKVLLGGDAEARRAAAKIMADIDRRLADEDRMERRIVFSKKLAEWIKLETEVSEEYREVTGRLENLAETVISQAERPGDVTHILEAYYLIQQGNLDKDEAIQALAANMLQNISTDQILDILLKDAESKEDSGRDDIYSLVILGSTTVERLLDRLRDSRSMAERNRIVQAVSRMGKTALDPVVQRLQQDEPWYYIRNLTLLLGRIGGQEHLDVLEPLLTYPDARVQVEAVKSIQAINGDKAGEVLLKNVDTVEPQLVSYIISVLGALRSEAAVPYLIQVLESKRLWQSKTVREEIRAKACEALGRIRSAEAIGPLEKVVRERGLFKGYSENIRSVAAKALANIKRG